MRLSVLKLSGLVLANSRAPAVSPKPERRRDLPEGASSVDQRGTERTVMAERSWRRLAAGT
jgi:hypothetical protein